MTADEIGDQLEKWCAHPLALPVFTAAFALGMLTIGVDVTNIAVSYFTVALLLLGMSRSRRSEKAVHVKLDDLEVKVPQATTENAGLEDEPEDVIDAKRAEYEGGE